LIAALPEAAAAAAAPADYHLAIHASRAIETVATDPTPPLAGTAVRGGGTALLKDQAACPFRAFARHRLQAAAPDAPHAGLDAAERGTLVHRVLAQVWMQLKDSAGLRGIDAARLDALLDDAASAAIERIRRDRPTVLSGRFADIERRRLAGLARAWLEEDRKRSDFSVIAVEDKRTMTIGGLELNARLDRVDESVDGRRIIIDYKTGEAGAATMLGARPDEPQLPLYLVTAEPGAAAVAFARVRAGRMAYAGLARDGDLLPGVKAHADTRLREQYPQWGDVVASWESGLARLAADFAAGRAVVDPKSYPHSCRLCDLHPLCRVRERFDAAGDDGEQS
jgi:ATP-dependent helicase/nuclease subunit B